jgi:hypothetical protein
VSIFSLFLSLSYLVPLCLLFLFWIIQFSYILIDPFYVPLSLNFIVFLSPFSPAFSYFAFTPFSRVIEPKMQLIALQKWLDDHIQLSEACNEKLFTAALNSAS